MTTEIFRDFFLGEVIITVTFFLHLEGHFESLSLISFVVLRVFDSAFVSTVLKWIFFCLG